MIHRFLSAAVLAGLTLGGCAIAPSAPTQQQISATVAAIYNGRANFHLERNQTDQAIENYDEAIRLDPTSAAAFQRRGAIHRANGQLELAIADYSEHSVGSIALLTISRRPSASIRKMPKSTMHVL
jgi:Tfp pilus assembly protein PilF